MFALITFIIVIAFLLVSSFSIDGGPMNDDNSEPNEALSLKRMRTKKPHWSTTDSKKKSKRPRQSPTFTPSATCSGDYNFNCEGCGKDKDFCCNKECSTIFCKDIAKFCKV